MFYLIIYNFYFLAQCGDYAAEDYPDHTYLSREKYLFSSINELFGSS